MKAIKTNAIISGIRSKVDNSLGITLSTPEYTPEETTEFFRLKGLNVLLTIEPVDTQIEETLKIDREAGEMSLSQELRWKLKKKWGKSVDKEKWPDYQMYYRHIMRKIIEQVED